MIWKLLTLMVMLSGCEGLASASSSSSDASASPSKSKAAGRKHYSSSSSSSLSSSSYTSNHHHHHHRHLAEMAEGGSKGEANAAAVSVAGQKQRKANTVSFTIVMSIWLRVSVFLTCIHVC